MNEKTSVLIPCRNTERYIVECLDSLFKAGFDELIVYFDSCTDASLEKAFNWKQNLGEEGSKVHLINGTTPDPIGVQDARNLLFEQSSGDVICFFDSDDVYTHSNLQGLISRLSATPPNIAGLITPYRYWFREPVYVKETYTEYQMTWMEEVWQNFDKPVQMKQGRVDGAAVWGFPPPVEYLLARRQIQTGGILWKRSALKKLKQAYGSIWNPMRIGLQDTNLVLDALIEEYEFEVVPEYTHCYRWGWSLNQITQIKGVEYLKQVLEFLHRLYDYIPKDQLNLGMLIADEIYYSQRALDEATDSWKYAKLEEEPEFRV